VPLTPVAVPSFTVIDTAPVELALMVSCGVEPPPNEMAPLGSDIPMPPIPAEITRFAPLPASKRFTRFVSWAPTLPPAVSVIDTVPPALELPTPPSPIAIFEWEPVAVKIIVLPVTVAVSLVTMVPLFVKLKVLPAELPAVAVPRLTPPELFT